MKKISCVIMDWAGTAVDFGCFAPLNAFLKVFSEERGIDITYRQARAPMGLLKIDHIRAILNMSEVSEKFRTRFQRDWNEQDVNEMYASFEKHLFASLRNFTTPIPGVLKTMEILRAEGIRIGSTTGYTGKMMEIVQPEAEAKGYKVDNLVTPDDVRAGRPAPFMIYKNMIDLDIPSVEEVVKVGDTIADIKEGLNAKVWTIGLVTGSNEMGLDEKAYGDCPVDELIRLKQEVRESMLAAGAHFVLDNITELPACIEQINKKISTRNYLLLTPGPLSTSQTVREAMLQDWCTWDKDYNEGIVTPIRQDLLSIAGLDATEYTSVLLQGSGTYCVEATLGAAVRPEDKLLILANGAYGERMAEIARYYGINHVLVSLHEAEVITGEIARRALEENPGVTHLSMVHGETTTGLLNRIEEVAEVIRGRNITFIVDAMSTFGGIPVDIRGLGVDFLVSSANKCIQGVPGFGFIIAKREKLIATKGHARSLSLDIFAQWETMEKGRGKWRFTSPTHVVRAFYQAMRELKEEGGISARYARYQANHRVLVDGMRSLGFKTLLPDASQGPVITSFLYPEEGFSFNCFYEALKQHGFVIYPGKISDADTFRIGTIGDVFPTDMEALIQAIHEIRG